MAHITYQHKQNTGFALPSREESEQYAAYCLFAGDLQRKLSPEKTSKSLPNSID
jgi:hypothetical protein